MRISRKHKFIFFAAPRTGSTSVRSVLDDFSDVQSIHITETTKTSPFYHHISPREVIDVFEQRGWDYTEYRTFCFVRNPYDRVVSRFHHQLKMIYGDDFLGRLRRRVKVFVHRQRRFTQFVENKVADGTGRLDEPVSSFVMDDEGSRLVDDILRFEELSSQLPEYPQSEFGLPVMPADIPKKNHSTRRNYRKYYDPHTKSIVKSTYGDDINLFNYSF